MSRPEPITTGGTWLASDPVISLGTGSTTGSRAVAVRTRTPTGVDVRPSRATLIEGRTAMAMGGVAAAVAGVGLWLGSGTIAWLTAAAIAALAVRAAQLDALTLTIPNRLVLVGLAVVALSVPVVAFIDDRALVSVVVGAAAGWCLSGAPIMFLLWLVRPASIGGGDWKWLSVLGATVGLVEPLAAPVLLLAACVVQLGHGYVRGRHRDVAFAPALAVGFLVALAAAILFGDQLGTGL